MVVDHEEIELAIQRELRIIEIQLAKRMRNEQLGELFEKLDTVSDLD